MWFFRVFLDFLWKLVLATWRTRGVHVTLWRVFAFQRYRMDSIRFTFVDYLSTLIIMQDVLVFINILRLRAKNVMIRLTHRMFAKFVVRFWNKGFKFFKRWEQPLLLCFVQSTISTEVTAQTLANRSAPLNELFCLGSPEQSPIASLLAYKTPVTTTTILCTLEISVPVS